MHFALTHCNGLRASSIALRRFEMSEMHFVVFQFEFINLLDFPVHTIYYFFKSAFESECDGVNENEWERTVEREIELKGGKKWANVSLDWTLNTKHRTAQSILFAPNVNYCLSITWNSIWTIFSSPSLSRPFICNTHIEIHNCLFYFIFCLFSSFVSVNVRRLRSKYIDRSYFVQKKASNTQNWALPAET